MKLIEGNLYAGGIKWTTCTVVLHTAGCGKGYTGALQGPELKIEPDCHGEAGPHQMSKTWQNKIKHLINNFYIDRC